MNEPRAAPPEPWTYCPYCSGRLGPQAAEGRARQTCTQCRRAVYRNPAPAAGAIVEKDGELLLVRRKRPPYLGSWTLPAGFVEYEEDVETTVRREIEEETGLIVEPRGVFGVYSYFDDPRQNGLLVIYRAETVGGTLRAGDDASEARFFAPEALPEEIGFAAHRRAVQDWRGHRR
jgi:ADP-ribose pyrophosphatase YjhB (NUDIX family)